MTDADRLRAAADRLEESDCLARCSDPYECCVHAGWQDYPDPWSLPVDPPDLATAALLRAVADEWEEDAATDATCWPRSTAAAVALADTILGETNR